MKPRRRIAILGFIPMVKLARASKPLASAPSASPP